jgi:hypothetical protein
MPEKTKKYDGGAAYPIDRTVQESFGLSKREWFAGMALAGLCQGYHENEVVADTVAARAFNIADAMIEVGEEASQ